ncbi:non-processive endocellulase [Pontibacter ummariensis]|uniref:Endoglucanase n=1 Tax=Pontibacter ummariensis TaxID=1610492 RepID=A0A239AZ52_9BACT|nr:glycoside hydrolase family 9 protein [Pontibacter ummariensis]PRY16162.1 non-processive endocellulase [Pontibacter ummariensis]SNS00248.1 non-processive endocellulase [Pontibacter ummariensis]
MRKQTLTKILCGLSLAALSSSYALAQEATDKIRLNQVGFYPQAPKVAVVVGENKGEKFYIKTADRSKTVYTGKLSAVKPATFSNKPTRVADFSMFSKPGSYVVEIPGVGRSYAFEVAPNVHKEVADAAIKGFYFQRVSTDLPEQYAGKWSRPAGHPEKEAFVHPSAASAARPTGTVIASNKGWYDAGDYNRYIVNSGITMGTLLSAYEDFPEYYQAQHLNIPESGDKVPDILDESLWNLRWMLTMQDPNDGGVYHKLTNANFDGMIMPAEATEPRYVVQKGTAATLDFAAVMAQASRIFRNYEQEFPGLADSTLTAAKKAWEWAQQNPNVAYDQNAMNKQFKPEVTTGAYGDNDFSDEFIWAASELYTTTKDDNYYKAVNILPDNKMPLPSWPQVRLLGYYTLARHGENLTAVGKKDLPEVKKRLVQFADELATGVSEHPYRTAMGKTKDDYIWGSSSVAANQGIALLQAYRLTKDKKYLEAALANLDYLLGRNATGYSFVTGYGEKSTMNPHHRPSIADGIEEPVPGLLSGGTNARADKQDNCPGYTSTFPDEMYVDNDCSYASNEIAINWNAPLVYLVGAIEAVQNEAGFSDQAK